MAGCPAHSHCNYNVIIAQGSAPGSPGVDSSHQSAARIPLQRGASLSSASGGWVPTPEWVSIFVNMSQEDGESHKVG